MHPRKCNLAGLSVLVAALFAVNGCVAQLTEPADERPGVPRMVLAFYYPWYGNPKVPGGSGRLVHWDRIDEGKREIISSTNYPSLGPYDSHDPTLIAQHCRWAKEANVDGFIVSWWGKGSFEDRAIPRILDGCQAAGVRATIYYETVPQPKNADTAATDIVQLLDKYAGHPAWLRVGGRPVLFVYRRALSEIGAQGWEAVMAQLSQRYTKGIVMIADRPDPGAAKIFAGTHTYVPARPLQGKTVEEVARWAKETYAAWVRTAKAHGRISTITVIPGYDDTKIRKPGLRVERMNGDLYRTQWQEAIAADPHWVLITSWNEWHEGSEIEPSAEFGEEYLKLTAELSAHFKAGR